jgi:hypothetical protein
MNNKWHVLVLISMIILNGCQTSPKNPVPRQSNIPEWINDYPPEGEVWGIGTGENKDLAIKRAQVTVIRELGTKWQGANIWRNDDYEWQSAEENWRFQQYSFSISIQGTISFSLFTSWIKENNISSYTFGDDYIDGQYWYGIAYKIPENIKRSLPGIIMPVISVFSLEAAVVNAANNVKDRLPEGSKIAIVNISAANRDDAVFVIEELSTELVKISREENKRYTIVDRRSLDAIRRERNLQLSGDVSDETIVSIGKFLGANVVITGSITGANEFRRLRVKALDVETARLLIQTNMKY